jgi:hypothetical protein
MLVSFIRIAGTNAKEMEEPEKAIHGFWTARAGVRACSADNCVD